LAPPDTCSPLEEALLEPIMSRFENNVFHLGIYLAKNPIVFQVYLVFFRIQLSVAKLRN
jgi:hypothetical protein